MTSAKPTAPQSSPVLESLRAQPEVDQSKPHGFATHAKLLSKDVCDTAGAAGLALSQSSKSLLYRARGISSEAANALASISSRSLAMLDRVSRRFILTVESTM